MEKLDIIFPSLDLTNAKESEKDEQHFSYQLNHILPELSKNCPMLSHITADVQDTIIFSTDFTKDPRTENFHYNLLFGHISYLRRYQRIADDDS